jgi:hypothetical protein
MRSGDQAGGERPESEKSAGLCIGIASRDSMCPARPAIALAGIGHTSTFGAVWLVRHEVQWVREF